MFRYGYKPGHPFLFWSINAYLNSESLQIPIYSDSDMNSVESLEYSLHRSDRDCFHMVTEKKKTEHMSESSLLLTIYDDIKKCSFLT